jgi:purine-binding chemotaxis protein CheW
MNEKLGSYLTFTLNEESFAINVARVIEILEVPRITKIPKAPDYMKGVINLRGNVLPIIDTRIKFSMPSTENTIDTCIIVLEIDIEDEQIIIGAIVDSVKEVVEFSDMDIKPSPAIGTQYNAEFIEGIVKLNDKFSMILDIGKIFSVNDIPVLNQQENK